MDENDAGSGANDDKTNDDKTNDDKANDGTSATERDMARADVANGEGDPDDAVNDTEERYGEDESPA